MSDLISIIKELAHEVSEKYLIAGADMNDQLIDLYQKGEIENEEVLKRVCEQANQIVYLALFNNPEVDNSNIKFDMADSAKVLDESKENEEAMINYAIPPEDYRSTMFDLVISTDREKTAGEKLAELNDIVEKRNTIKNFLTKVEIMKTAEEHIAENSFEKMAHDAKMLVTQGESIGDISKIATRHVKEDMEGDFMKVAKSYNMIHKNLRDSGFHVKTGFTKLSSRTINSRSEMLEPVREFAFSLAKIAGLAEMHETITKRLSVFDKVIKEAQE